MFKACCAIALLTLPVQATEIGCATDPTAVVAQSAHRTRVYAKAGSPAEMRNGMFVVAKSQENVTLDHPNDLEGRSVRFVPAGADRYTATALDSQYDSDVGPQVRQFILNTSQSDWPYVRVDLKNTSLTLFGQNVRTIYVTAFNSITLGPPQGEFSTQYDTNAASFTGAPTISPLLMTSIRMSGFNWPTAYVRETSDGVLVTWRALGNVFSYDVQAKISAAGEIVFSYKTLGKVTWGAAVITPGAGAFMSRLTPVAQAADEAGDAPKPELDITSVAAQHVEGTGAYLLLITFGADLLKTPPARGDSTVISIDTGGAEPLTVTIGWNKLVTFTGGGGSVEGNQLQAAVFAETSRAAHIVIETSLLSMNAAADRATVDVNLTGGFTPGVDLSRASGTELELPLVEAFTVPNVDLQSVWDSVRATASLKDNDIDGVAVFENFTVDAVLKSAAWATIGNSGADGIWKYVRHGSAYPRAPNLMQMNVMDWVLNTAPENVAGTLMHEFGHRWLQFVETMENGTPTITLNPSPAHPPQFASAPAAFPVLTQYDTSAMGGGYFTQSGNTFTAAVKSAVGYSWFDLYLMGLAAEEEVPPMYVIDGTNLGMAYTPPSNVVVTGTRHDVTLQQVIAAMGPRRPSAASSQHEFKVVFVLLSEPGRNVDADLVALERVRSTFVEMFGKATGRRAFVETLFNPGGGGRRRAVRP
jgi:hypothetical protein